MSRIKTLTDCKADDQFVSKHTHELQIKQLRDAVSGLVKKCQERSKLGTLKTIEVQVLEQKIISLNKRIAELTNREVCVVDGGNQDGFLKGINDMLMADAGMSPSDIENYRAKYILEVDKKFGVPS